MTGLRPPTLGDASLAELTSCFQGLIPATLFTCSRDGVPNAAIISHVDYVDASRVALSFQFFNKSHKNIAENPHAMVRLTDPDSGQAYRLRLRYLHAETSGPVFDRMALRIEAIASYCGLKGIFKLLAADIYEVSAVEKADEDPGNPLAEPRPHEASGPVFTMQALQDLAARIHRADSLERLLDSILEGLEESFGFGNSMIALPSEEQGVLVTIASRGYPQGGAGAEVRIGEGIIGVVAEARKPIRISGLLRQMLYAWAVHKRAQEEGIGAGSRRIPLPGLPSPESQLGVPLLVRGELVGVLCIESQTKYRFHEEDRATIELLGSYLAIAIQNMQLQEAAEGSASASAKATADKKAGHSVQKPPDAAGSVQDRPGQPDRPRREIAYYGTDECILVDGEYLIRSMPARILWRLLRRRDSEGRVEFTNRELRLDKSLNLPEWKDNLETRLLLLRRRLEEKCPDIRIAPRGRGRFAIELGCDVALIERP